MPSCRANIKSPPNAAANWLASSSATGRSSEPRSASPTKPATSSRSGDGVGGKAGSQTTPGRRPRKVSGESIPPPALLDVQVLAGKDQFLDRHVRAGLGIQPRRVEADRAGVGELPGEDGIL